MGILGGATSLTELESPHLSKSSMSCLRLGIFGGLTLMESLLPHSIAEADEFHSSHLFDWLANGLVCLGTLIYAGIVIILSF